MTKGRKAMLHWFPDDADVIIEGEAKGADSMARVLAKKLGIKVEPYPAKWDEHGKAAGAIRNSQMLKEGKPDFCLAFHNDIKKSKGTADMVKKCQASGIPGKIINDDGICYGFWEIGPGHPKYVENRSRPKDIEQMQDPRVIEGRKYYNSEAATAAKEVDELLARSREEHKAWLTTRGDVSIVGAKSVKRIKKDMSTAPTVKKTVKKKSGVSGPTKLKSKNMIEVVLDD